MSIRKVYWIAGFIFASLTMNTDVFAQFKPDYAISVAVSDVLANPRNKPDLLGHQEFVEIYQALLDRGKIDLFRDVESIEFLGNVPTVKPNKMVDFSDTFGKLLIVARLGKFGAFRSFELAGNLVREDGGVKIYKVPRDLQRVNEPDFYFAFIETNDTGGGEVAVSGDPDFASLAISRLKAIRLKIPENSYLSARANTKSLVLASVESEKQAFVDGGGNLDNATGPWLPQEEVNAIGRTKSIEVWLKSRPDSLDLADVRITSAPGFGPPMHSFISAVSGQSLGPGEPNLPDFKALKLQGDQTEFSFDFRFKILNLLKEM